MPNIEAQPEWANVREIGIELARGGPDGNMNEQAKALVARTELLKEEKANKTDIVQGQYRFTTLAKFNAVKSTIPVNSTVIIDEAGENQGANTWDGQALTKSDYDPVNQANDYTDKLSEKDNEQMNYLIEKINSIIKTFNLNSHNLNTGEKIWLSIQDKFLRSVFSVGEKNLQWNDLNFKLEKGSKSIKITDKIGRTILSLNKDGISFGNSKIIPSLSSMLADKIGRSAIKINKDGSVSIPKLTVQSIKKQGEFGTISEISASVAQEFPKLGFQTYPKRIGVISSGQSLNMGGTGSEPDESISTTQPFSNVMFDGGTQSDAWDINYTPNSFVPLVGGARGLHSEFPAINGCNALSRQINKSADLDANDYPIFCSVIGEGSQSVEQMITKYLPKLKHSVTNFKELCDKNGETCEIWALCWIQGEGDSYVNAYKDHGAGVLHYMSEAIDHIMQTTKQAAMPYIYIYQFSSFYQWATQNGYKVAQNEWLMSKSVPNVVCFTPMYIFDYIDMLHLTPENYWFMGEYIGRAIHHTQFANQGKFRPVEPIEVVWTDNYIDIVYHAPKYPIRFTTDVVTQALNQGFCFYKNKQYQAGFISSVELKDYRTVRINLTAPITDPDFEICYARGITGTDVGTGRTTGNRGNVADSTRETVTSPKGNSRIISHHSVMFTYHKTNGFVV